MKYKLSFLSLIGLAALTGCSMAVANPNAENSTNNNTSNSEYNTDIDQTNVEEITAKTATGDFAITTDDGEFANDGNVYTIKKAGTYVLSGKLEGQVVVDAGEDEEVILELNSVTIIYDQDSPIKVITADKVEISAKDDTDNIVTDNRSAKVTDDENLGEGAISARADLKLKGSGTLVVTGNYNNGVHTTKDLKIQKETLKVTGYNNAIKGKNSVTIESGTIQAYAKTGNGIKTEDSDITSSGNQKGTVTINGGNIYVDSLHDGIDASYDIVIDEVDSTVETNVLIKTGTKSTVYNKSSFKSDSEKGLKSQNNIVVNKGTVIIDASDDAVHANYGITLENGKKGEGNITLNDGKIQIASGDDGLHSDNTLTINGGVINVTNSTEGLEANYININGGQTYVYATNDGVNASKKSFSNCSFTMSDGYLDVSVASGDTDGIDSNGTVTIKGGIIVTRGSPGSGGGMSTGLDVDGLVSMSGGTLISFNGLETYPTCGSGVLYAGTTAAGQSGEFPSGGGAPGFNGTGRPGGNTSGTTGSLSNGEYTLKGGSMDITFQNNNSYGSFMVYSSSLVKNTSYTLSRGGTTVYSWTQSSNSVTIS